MYEILYLQNKIMWRPAQQ